MSKKSLFPLTILLIFITVNSYLFITAPEPIKDNNNKEGYTFSVNEGFNILAKLNDEYRTLYTKKIVGQGKKAGLKFDEDWLKDKVEAGPLPALFLRETAAFLEKSPIPIGLYLGSDFPISKSNLLTGIQAEKFKEIKQDKAPKYFFDAETDRNIAMFPDFAAAAACVSCHNNHENSPKTDWQLNDVMGATTWSYPQDSLSTNQLIEWIDIFNQGAQSTYSSYLEKTKKFETNKKPTIGEKWPSDGYFLPSEKILSDTLLHKASLFLITSILKNKDEY